MAQLSTAPPSSQHKAQQTPSPPAAQSDMADVASQRGSLLRALRRLWGFVPALMLGLALLIGWQLLAASGSISQFLLPTPADVLRAFGQAFASGLLPRFALTTLEESLVGFALGACIAVPLGYAIARSGLIRRAVEPYLAASQPDTAGSARRSPSRDGIRGVWQGFYVRCGIICPNLGKSVRFWQPNGRNLLE